MDRLKAMSILVRVVDTGSFSAASRALDIPLATVSRQVTELETHLGTRLLNRTTRTLALTDSGEAYLRAARRILEEVEEAEQTAAGEFQTPRGELVLTAPVCFGRMHTLPVVRDFLAVYPDINVRLNLSDRNLHLMDDHIDMAVRIGPLPDSGLIATRVGEVRTVVVASPDLLARHGTPETPEALSALPGVHFDILSPGARWHFTGPDGQACDVAPRPRLTVSGADPAIWAASEGVGVTRVLGYQCADAVKSGALRVVLEDYEPAPLPVHLLHAARGTMPTKMRVFLDFAKTRLRERLKALAC
ncbi:LysR family transcriptional regulator [Maricaulis parjimensis]|uniref:LysR family transcriptional regulator n=1 Tax=Maricaulis parjimensis TaxID=144023 RepID=UPI001939F2B5|nr:LysR family transcriptional regulator [Maricaulis parjimensis]